MLKLTDRKLLVSLLDGSKDGCDFYSVYDFGLFLLYSCVGMFELLQSFDKNVGINLSLNRS